MARTVRQKKLSILLARDFRRNATPAEKILWAHLRNRQVRGIKFRRQHPHRQYIFDFYSPESHLAIEVDGAIHSTPAQAERDCVRTETVGIDGIRVLRFSNEHILEDLEDVLKSLMAELGKGSEDE
jgi:very-short-patch-repair endonuclease